MLRIRLARAKPTGPRCSSPPGSPTFAHDFLLRPRRRGYDPPRSDPIMGPARDLPVPNRWVHGDGVAVEQHGPVPRTKAKNDLGAAPATAQVGAGLVLEAHVQDARIQPLRNCLDKGEINRRHQGLPDRHRKLPNGWKQDAGAYAVRGSRPCRSRYSVSRRRPPESR